MYEMQIDGLRGGANGSAGRDAVAQILEGDFASGVRTGLALVGVVGDFGIGSRSTPNTMVVGDFATGTRQLETVVVGRGDFATGQRRESTSEVRRVGRSTGQHDSPRWHTPQPVAVTGRL